LEVSGQLYATADLPPGKIIRYPLDKKAGWAPRTGTEMCLIEGKAFLMEAIIIIAMMYINSSPLSPRVGSLELLCLQATVEILVEFANHNCLSFLVV
jgi:hypothetical protein